MTAAIIDEMTDTASTRTANAPGRVGEHNLGLFWRYGGLRDDRPVRHQCILWRSRPAFLLWAGAFLLFIVVLGPLMWQIPMAALVAVMVMVSFNTFQLAVSPPLGRIRKAPAL